MKNGGGTCVANLSSSNTLHDCDRTDYCNYSYCCAVTQTNCKLRYTSVICQRQRRSSYNVTSLQRLMIQAQLLYSKNVTRRLKQWFHSKTKITYLRIFYMIFLLKKIMKPSTECTWDQSIWNQKYFNYGLKMWIFLRFWFATQQMGLMFKVRLRFNRLR